jgi:hypothetical protein
MDEYDRLSEETKKYELWRNRANKQIPDISKRVFNLRNTFYTGCGVHYSLERTLGYVILKLNDFDNYPITFESMFIHRSGVQLHLNHLFKKVVKAENEVIFNAKCNSNEQGSN